MAIIVVPLSDIKEANVEAGVVRDAYAHHAQHRDWHGFPLALQAVKKHKAWTDSWRARAEKAELHEERWLEFRLSARGGSSPGMAAQVKMERALINFGIPDYLRSQVWQELCGATGARKRERGLYAELVHKANLDGSPWSSDIGLDVPRTFPDHAMLSSTRRGKEVLRRVLLAYSLYNPKVGYCQSMNFIAAFLLLRMDEEGAFWTMVMLLGERRYMAGYYQADMVECQVDQLILGDLVAENLPLLYRHLENLDIAFNTLSMRWFLCLFISVLPTETTMRVWDIFMREGRVVLFQISIAVLKIHEKDLLSEDTFEDCVDRLKDLLLTSYNADELVEAALYDESSFTQEAYDRILETTRPGYVDLVTPDSAPKAATKASEGAKEGDVGTGRGTVGPRVSPATSATCGTQETAAQKVMARAAIQIQTAWRYHQAGKRLLEILQRSWAYQLADIAACWEELHQPLAHRSKFFIERCETPRFRGLLRLRGLRSEARRLHSKRHKLRREEPDVPLSETKSILAAQKALQQERHALYNNLKLLEDSEKEKLFDAWGIGKASKARKEKLISMVWTSQADLAQSAGLVMWLLDSGDRAARQRAVASPAKSPGR